MAIERAYAPAAEHASASGVLGPLLAIFAAALRGLLTGKRWLLVVALDVAFVGLAVILAFQADGQHQLDLVDLFRNLGLPALLPFVALLFATETFGGEIEDRTLIYLTLRPLPAVGIAAAKFAAATLITIVATWLALLASFVLLGLSDAPAGQLPALLIAGALGSAAYCAAFMLLGLLLRRALLIGAIYVLIWEGAFAGLSTSAAHLSVRFYTFGVYAGVLRRNDLVALDTFPAAPGSLIFLVILTLAAVWSTGDRLRRIELP